MQFADGRAAEEAEFWTELQPGRLLYVYYTDDPGIWHAVLLVYPEGKGFHVLTPDGDLYWEDVCARTGETVVRPVLCRPDRSAPANLPGQLYKFRTKTPDETLRLYMEVLKEEVPASTPAPKMWFGENGEPRRMEEPQEGAAGQVVKARRGRAEQFVMNTPEKSTEVGQGKADATELSGGAWTTLEETEALVRFSLVEPKSTDVVRDRRGLCLLSGAWVAVGYLTDAEQEAMEVKTLDNRILEPVVYDSKDSRNLDYGEAISRMKEEPMEDFPLKSRRSLAWLLKYVRDHGTTFDCRQTRWATEQKIDPESAAYVFHDLVGYALELGATYDQLDMVNLASFELLGRVYHMIEETRGQMTTEGLDHYIGRDSTGGVRRGIALAPGLAEDAVSKQSKETEILKQRRKAREERALAKSKGGKPNNQG